MIVPCQRLLIWTALVVLPAGLLAGVIAPLFPIAAAVVILFAALAALEAMPGLTAEEIKIVEAGTE